MSENSIVPAGKQADIFETATFDPTRPVKISVTNHDGEVQVRPTEENQVTVKAYKLRSRSGNGSDDSYVFESDNNTITFRPNWQVGSTVSDIAQKVKAQLKEGFRAEDWDFKKMRFAGDISYDVEVLVPRSLPEGSTIAVKTTSGDVQVHEMNASVSVASASGDVRLDQIHGKVSAHSASGDVTMRTMTGSVETNTASGDISLEGGDAWTALRSVSGDITVRQLTMKSARVTTVSGTVTVDATLNNAAEYTFDSVSGDMRLTTLVPSRGASMTYRSLSGDASIEGSWVKASGKRTWKIGDAEDSPRIAVKTVSGDLTANGMVDDTLEARTETMPSDVREAAESAEPAASAPSDGATDEGGHSVVIDADWERAKGWLKDISQRVSKFIEDLDNTGDRRYQQQQSADASADETAPIDAQAIAETSSPTEPLAPPAPQAPTEPLPPAGPDVAPEPPRPAEPDVETTAQRRLRLLEAVQRGEMTVDEALAQLDDSTTSS